MTLNPSDLLYRIVVLSCLLFGIEFFFFNLFWGFASSSGLFNKVSEYCVVLDEVPYASLVAVEDFELSDKLFLDY